jgi:hypothetical protein
MLPGIRYRTFTLAFIMQKPPPDNQPPRQLSRGQKRYQRSKTQNLPPETAKGQMVLSSRKRTHGNRGRNTRPQAPEGVREIVKFVDKAIHVVLFIPHFVFMLLLNGNQYADWVGVERKPPQKPIELLGFVVLNVGFTLAGMVKNWGMSVGLTLLAGNPYGAWGWKHVRNSYVSMVDYNLAHTHFFFKLAFLIIKVLIAFTLLRTFFVIVLPINITQAFIRGSVKWFVGLPGSFFYHFSDSFLL